MSEVDDRYTQLIEEAAKKAADLRNGSKNHDYNNGGVERLEYFDYEGLEEMPKKLFHEVHKKYLRIKSLLLSGSDPQNESLADNAIDLANYALFLAGGLTLLRELRGHK